MSIQLFECLEAGVDIPVVANAPLALVNEVSAERPSNWQITRLFAGLIITQALTERGIFDDTPRIYGTTDEDELLILPHYKLRTMSEEAKAEASALRAAGEFIKGVHDTRTGFRKFIAKTSLDEIPVYPLMGVHNWFGDARPVLVEEKDNPELQQAVQEYGMSVQDVFSAMNGRIGYFCTQHTFGARVMEGVSAWRSFIRSVIVDDEQRPSKLRRLYAVFHKDIRKQTSSPVQDGATDELSVA